MLRTFGWTMAALIGVDQLMMHGAYMAAAAEVLEHIFAGM
jgi:hypothetical protein